MNKNVSRNFNLNGGLCVSGEILKSLEQLKRRRNDNLILQLQPQLQALINFNCKFEQKLMFQREGREAVPLKHRKIIVRDYNRA